MEGISYIDSENYRHILGDSGARKLRLFAQFIHAFIHWKLPSRLMGSRKMFKIGCFVQKRTSFHHESSGQLFDYLLHV